MNEEPLPIKLNNPVPSSEMHHSPHWSGMTKLVVSLALMAILLWLLAKFQNYFGLLLTSLIFTILLRPIVKWFNQHLKISWSISTIIVYVVVAILLLGLITWGGIALFGQLQNLISLLISTLQNLTKSLSQWSNQVIMIGPFSFTVPELTTKYLSDLLIGRVQPLLEGAGVLIGKAISGGANLLFRAFMMYLIAFFVTSESSRENSKPLLTLAGYEEDIERMQREISHIWSAFLQGQFIVVFTAFMVYSIFLSIMHLPFALGLAIIIGLGRFIPYIGAWVGWITLAIVSLIIQPTPFGLAPLAYTGILIASALIIDNILDNLLTPKVMGNALKIHPAAVLVTALIGSQLFGLVGIILAAPVYASAKLVFMYAFSKLTDQDPWQGITYQPRRKENLLTKEIVTLSKKIWSWLKKAWSWVKAVIKKWYTEIRNRFSKRKPDNIDLNEK